MPLAAERSLKTEARKHGFKKGTRRYNAYVYGTMNKLGILTSNHAGSLAPDRMIGKVDLDYRPTFANVHGVHIAVIVALLLLIVWHVNFSHPSFINPGKNGDGATGYINTQSYAGWKDVQYNALGATAGALYGESN